MNRFLGHIRRGLDLYLAIVSHDLVAHLHPGLRAKAENAVAAGAKPKMWRMLRNHAMTGDGGNRFCTCECHSRCESWSVFHLGEALVLGSRRDYPFWSSDGKICRRICLLDRKSSERETLQPPRVSSLGVRLGQRVIHDWILSNRIWGSLLSMSPEEAATDWAAGIRTCPLTDRDMPSRYFEPPHPYAAWIIPGILTVRCVIVDAFNVCCRVTADGV